MGTRCAPPFANLFLGSLEEKALSQWTGTHPLLWLRFLDNILMLWTGNQEELERLLTHLNLMMKTIKFTMSQDSNSITFLDLEIYKGRRFAQKGILNIKPYIKPTNPQTFLHFESCHPHPIFNTIVKGEIIRALRSSSDVETFTTATSKLLKRFLERGYPKAMLMEIASTISYGDRPHFLISRPKRKPEENTTIFSARFHPALDSHNIREALVDRDTPFLPMIVRPRPTSTQDLLVRAKTPGRSKVRVERKGDSSQQPLPSTELGSTSAAAPPTLADTPPLHNTET